MKRREFNKIIRSITVVEDGCKKLSVKLLHQLPNTIKNQMIQYIVKFRAPVLTALINSDTDIRWLHSMGYLYQKSGAEYDFVTHGG